MACYHSRSHCYALTGGGRLVDFLSKIINMFEELSTYQNNISKFTPSKKIPHKHIITTGLGTCMLSFDFHYSIIYIFSC